MVLTGSFQAMVCLCNTFLLYQEQLLKELKFGHSLLFASNFMAGFIYPISMGWQWGGGWLATSGFSDFAGSTLVHACGGAAALAGVIVLGAREGRFG